MPIRIAVGPGMSIVIHDEGSPGYKGPNKEEVFNCARFRVRFANMDEQSLEHIERWVEMMGAVIDEEEVQRAAEPRLRAARKLLRKHDFAVEPAEAEIFKQERQKLERK